jgi:hypothetical protein
MTYELVLKGGSGNWEIEDWNYFVLRLYTTSLHRIFQLQSIHSIPFCTNHWFNTPRYLAFLSR